MGQIPKMVSMHMRASASSCLTPPCVRGKSPLSTKGSQAKLNSKSLRASSCLALSGVRGKSSQITVSHTGEISRRRYGLKNGLTGRLTKTIKTMSNRTCMGGLSIYMYIFMTQLCCGAQIEDGYLTLVKIDGPSTRTMERSWDKARDPVAVKNKLIAKKGTCPNQHGKDSVCDKCFTEGQLAKNNNGKGSVFTFVFYVKEADDGRPELVLKSYSTDDKYKQVLKFRMDIKRVDLANTMPKTKNYTYADSLRYTFFGVVTEHSKKEKNGKICFIHMWLPKATKIEPETRPSVYNLLNGKLALMINEAVPALELFNQPGTAEIMNTVSRDGQQETQQTIVEDATQDDHKEEPQGLQERLVKIAVDYNCVQQRILKKAGIIDATEDIDELPHTRFIVEKTVPMKELRKYDGTSLTARDCLQYAQVRFINDKTSRKYTNLTLKERYTDESGNGYKVKILGFSRDGRRRLKERLNFH